MAAHGGVLQVLPAPVQVEHLLQLGQGLVHPPAELSCRVQCGSKRAPGLPPAPTHPNSGAWALMPRGLGRGFAKESTLGSDASGLCAALGHPCSHTCWRRGGQGDRRQCSPVALTMLSSRGRSEGGALWGRRYVKKNLGPRNQGLKISGDIAFLYPNLGQNPSLTREADPLG